jgi:hypothetical protein
MCRRMTTSTNDICRRQIFSFLYGLYMVYYAIIHFSILEIYASSDIRIWLGLLGPTSIRGAFACLIKKNKDAARVTG